MVLGGSMQKSGSSPYRPGHRDEGARRLHDAAGLLKVPHGVIAHTQLHMRDISVTIRQYKATALVPARTAQRQFIPEGRLFIPGWRRMLQKMKPYVTTNFRTGQGKGQSMEQSL